MASLPFVSIPQASQSEVYIKKGNKKGQEWHQSVFVSCCNFYCMTVKCTVIDL